MDFNHAAAAVGVGVTVAGIIAGAAKFRPGLDRHVRDAVDLAAYTLRGIGSATALYSLLAVDTTAWGVAIGGLALGSIFVAVFGRATRPKHRQPHQAEHQQHHHQCDGQSEDISHG
jgi:hypothetical protein